MHIGVFLIQSASFIHLVCRCLSVDHKANVVDREAATDQMDKRGTLDQEDTDMHESGCRILPTQPHMKPGDFQVMCSIDSAGASGGGAGRGLAPTGNTGPNQDPQSYTARNDGDDGTVHITSYPTHNSRERLGNNNRGRQALPQFHTREVTAAETHGHLWYGGMSSLVL